MTSIIWIFLTFLGLRVSAETTIETETRGLCSLHYVTGPRDYCFRFAEDKKTFDQALEQCETEGGSLAATRDDDVYSFVRQHIEGNPVKANIAFGIFGEVSIFTPWGNGWYVGASKKDGSFKWLDDGETIGGHWTKDRPDNFGWHEDCLQQMATNNGWNDVPCDWKLRYVCQKKVSDPCADDYCGMHAKCVDRGKEAVCICNAGYEGSRCERRVNPCASVDCGNGHCRVDPQQYRAVCLCHDGWKGAFCTERIVVDVCATRKPCWNGGVCYSNAATGGYRCDCPAKFQGIHCEEIRRKCRFVITKRGLPEKLDVMVLIDGSASVTDENFDKSLRFVARFVDRLEELKENKARVEVVQFSHRLEEVVDFAGSVRLGKVALIDRILHIVQHKGATFSGTALEFANDVFEKDSRRDDKEVAKFVLFLTDGKSQQEAKIRAVVPKLKAKDVDVIAIGVGDETSREELKLIADGNLDHVFSVDSFDELDAALISKLTKKMC